MMKRIKDYLSFFATEAEGVLELLNEWVPSGFTSDEKTYEIELYEYLKRRLPDVPISTQYGIAKGKADLVIQDSHLLELKLGLTDVGELDRCIGQLERYRQKWIEKDMGPVYLVIVGESDPEFRDVLMTWLAKANTLSSLSSFSAESFNFIEKRPQRT
jgi:hypothetical protein